MSRRTTSETAASTEIVQKRRCAVYTRKSTEEGLEKEFNTLNAQRDACAAYVASQRAEGWVLVPDRYDDGGFSVATLDRPALRRLIADVMADCVDAIVCYRIDRLSRSLMDFAKLVEIFDRHNATFVFVTESFNTVTSMGRLTLNILLSFAQFEREVIGERIRDKFAASRARGMWMGGSVPLGYDVRDRKLVVNEVEASAVRRIFEGFAEIGSGTKLRKVLRSAGCDHEARQANQQGRHLQAAQQPDLCRRSRAQGQRLFGRAPDCRLTRVVGPRAPDPAGKSAGARQQEPRTKSGTAARPNLRCRRTSHVAHTHAPARTAIPLLCQPIGAEGRWR